ncbi:MAG: energy transducer TonB [Cytophagaceae bacterium]
METLKSYHHIIFAFCLLLFIASCTEPQREEIPSESQLKIIEEKIEEAIYEEKGKEDKVIIKANLSAELKEHYGASSQKYTINNHKDTLIIGQKGTEIFLPKGCFTPSSASMKITLKEAYTREDLFFNNLATITDKGELLGSNGMILLDVESKTKVSINPQNPVAVKFPSQSTMPSDLFLSKTDAEGNIEWIATNNTVSASSTTLIPQDIISQSPQMIITTGSFELSNLDLGIAFCHKCYDSLLSNIEYPASLKPRNVKGDVYIDLTVSDVGELEKVFLVQGIHPQIDQMLLKSISTSWDWIPGFVGGRPVTSKIRYKFIVHGSDKNFSIQVPLVTLSHTEFDLARYAYWMSEKENYKRRKANQREWQQKLKVENELLIKKNDSLRAVQAEKKKAAVAQYTSANAEEKMGYIYSLTTLGSWINCDYFINTPANRMAVLKIKPSNPLADVKILFLDNNLSMIRAAKKGAYYEVRIPTDTPSLVVATAGDNRGFYIGAQELTIVPGTILDLPMEAASLEQIMEKVMVSL